MRKILFAYAALMALAACNCKQEPTFQTEGNDESIEVAFEVAKNYFFKKDLDMPASLKITSAEAFSKLFGMATTMGKDGKPTDIDFTRQFVLAIVLPVTDIETEITPIKVKEKGDSLFYTYQVMTGEQLSFDIQPISIIILDKKYENKEVVLEKRLRYKPDPYDIR